MSYTRFMSLSTGLMLLGLCCGLVMGADSDIRLNSLGYPPKAAKKATILLICPYAVVINMQTGEQETVASMTIMTGPVPQSDVNQQVSIADFSSLTAPGRYYLRCEGVGRSLEFEVSPAVYNDAFNTAMRGFYLWRCGMAVSCDYQGRHYEQKPCHLEDGWGDYTGQPNQRRDGVGGWHDAGDFGKYTVNAGITVGMLLLAWEQFPEHLKGVKLDLPETAPGYPDYLKEIKWETDWLLKMAYPDGSGRVSHKLTAHDFCGFIMPDQEKDKRYFTDWSSAATADYVAVMAKAARAFEPYDPNYAATCLKAAQISYQFLREHPDNKRADLKDFSTGAYQTGDEDDRLWAAAEIWQTTGDPAALDDFHQRARKACSLIQDNWDWGNVANLGMITYLLSNRKGHDLELTVKIRQELIASADRLVEIGQKDIYGRPLGEIYYWGCNGTVARQAVLLQTANQIAPRLQYQQAVGDIISHLLGRNYYGRSYITGVGINPPLNPHDRRSGADGIKEPWPGYLVGGGQNAVNWQDIQEDYRTNEIAINWQAALVYALAGLVDASAGKP